MVHLGLMEIFLYYRLGGVDRSRDIYVLDSGRIGHPDWLSDNLSGHMLVSVSLKVHLYVLSLDGRLNILSVVVVRCRPLDCFGSLGGVVLSLSVNGRLGFASVLLSLELDGFVVVDDLSVVDRLGDVLLTRGVHGSLTHVGLGLGISGDGRVVYGSGLSSVHVHNLLNSLHGRLDIFFSDSKLSWNVHVDGSHLCLVVYDWVSGDPLGVNRSLHDFSSLYRGLHNSLSNDRLLGDSFGNYRLGDHLSGHHWLALNLLGLSNHRLGVVGHG